MKILLIDDDNSSRNALEKFISNILNHDVTSLNSCEKGWEEFQKEDYDLVITDIKMPQMSGIELLEKIKSSSKNEIDVIVITGFGELDTSIQALRAGAEDYLLKPINIEELSLVIERIEKRLKLEKENTLLKETTIDIKEKLEDLKSIYSEQFQNEKIGFFSPAMNEVIKLSETFNLNPDIPVLLEGETGVGKEVIAKLIHNGTSTNNNPFIALNCSAISPTLFESELFGYEDGAFTGAQKKGKKGKFELAENGTIFLDEISDLPLDLQPKLLRVIQEQSFYRVSGAEQIPIKARIICASNQNLKEKVANGTFRRDLYFRLTKGEIIIPPLRKRKEDIIPLTKLFMEMEAKKRNKNFTTISGEAIDTLLNYNWPGNIRELKGIIERIVLIFDGDTIRNSHLEPYIVKSLDKIESNTNQILLKLPDSSFDADEINYIITKKILDKFDQNISKTAHYLNVSWATVVKRARLKKSKA